MHLLDERSAEDPHVVPYPEVKVLDLSLRDREAMAELTYTSGLTQSNDGHSGYSVACSKWRKGVIL